MLKKAGFLWTDHLQTIDYDNDVTLDDIETVGFNNNTQMADLNGIHEMELKRTSATQQTAKTFIKKYKDLKKREEFFNYNKLNKKQWKIKDDVVFIKQTPVHPRDRFQKLATIKKKKAEGEEVNFIKQIPVHSRDQKKKKTWTC